MYGKVSFTYSLRNSKNSNVVSSGLVSLPNYDASGLNISVVAGQNPIDSTNYETDTFNNSLTTSSNYVSITFDNSYTFEDSSVPTYYQVFEKYYLIGTVNSVDLSGNNTIILGRHYNSGLNAIAMSDESVSYINVIAANETNKSSCGVTVEISCLSAPGWPLPLPPYNLVATGYSRSFTITFENSNIGDLYYQSKKIELFYVENNSLPYIDPSRTHVISDSDLIDGSGNVSLVSIASNLTGTSYTYNLPDTNDSDDKHYVFVAVAYNDRGEISQDDSGNVIYASTAIGTPVTNDDRINKSGPYDSSEWLGNSSIRYYTHAQTDSPFQTPYPPYNLNVVGGLNKLTISWSQSPKKSEESGNTSYELFIVGSSVLDSSRSTQLTDSHISNSLTSIYSGTNTSYVYTNLADNTRYAFVIVSYNSQGLISQDSNGNTIYGTTESGEISSDDHDVYDSSNWKGQTTIAYYAQGITNAPTINTSFITTESLGPSGIRWVIEKGSTGSQDNSLWYSGFVKLNNVNVDNNIFEIYGPDVSGATIQQFWGYILNGVTSFIPKNVYFTDLAPGQSYTGTIYVWTNLSDDNDENTDSANWSSNSYSSDLTSYSLSLIHISEPTRPY